VCVCACVCMKGVWADNYGSTSTSVFSRDVASVVDVLFRIHIYMYICTYVHM